MSYYKPSVYVNLGGPKVAVPPKPVPVEQWVARDKTKPHILTSTITGKTKTDLPNPYAEAEAAAKAALSSEIMDTWDQYFRTPPRSGIRRPMSEWVRQLTSDPLMTPSFVKCWLDDCEKTGHRPSYLGKDMTDEQVAALREWIAAAEKPKVEPKTYHGTLNFGLPSITIDDQSYFTPVMARYHPYVPPIPVSVAGKPVSHQMLMGSEISSANRAGHLTYEEAMAHVRATLLGFSQGGLT